MFGCAKIFLLQSSPLLVTIAFQIHYIGVSIGNCEWLKPKKWQKNGVTYKKKAVNCLLITQKVRTFAKSHTILYIARLDSFKKLYIINIQ